MAGMEDIKRGSRVVFDHKGMRVYTPGQYRPPKFRNPNGVPYYKELKKKRKARWGRKPRKAPARNPVKLNPWPSVKPGRSPVPSIPLKRVTRIGKRMGNIIPGPGRMVIKLAEWITDPPWVITDPGGYKTLDDDPFDIWGTCRPTCLGYGPLEAVSVSGGGCLLRCQTYQVPAFEFGTSFIVDRNVHNAIHLGPYRSNGIDPKARMDYAISFVFNQQNWPGPFPIPRYIPVPFTPPTVLPLIPWGEPETAPAYGPMDVYGFGAPVGAPDPTMSPGLDPDPGMGDPVRPSPAGDTLPPYMDPAINVPQTGRPTPGYHPHVPDRGKKMVFKPGIIGSLYGGLTEIGDAVDAIDKAMKGRPCKGLPMHEKIACIFANMGDIDPIQAGLNIGAQQAQDRAIGKFGQLGKKAIGNAGKRGYYRGYVGLGTGGGFTRPPGVSMTNL